MKKKLALLCSLILVVTLSGCSANKTQQNTQNTSSSSDSCCE
ncbi:hypothetical protein [Peptostreptococcus faecalis]|nr:hypothetical protein [Peptostreptococcus faecalis]